MVGAPLESRDAAPEGAAPLCVVPSGKIAQAWLFFAGSKARVCSRIASRAAELAFFGDAAAGVAGDGASVSSGATLGDDASWRLSLTTMLLFALTRDRRTGIFA